MLLIERLKKMYDILTVMTCEKKYISKYFKIVHSNAQKIYLIGAPLHGNIGDHLIAESSKKIVDSIFPNNEVIECSLWYTQQKMKLLKQYISSDDIIIIIGGGWMGNDWFRNEIFIRNIISNFPKNKVVIFPQTVHYANDIVDLEGKEIYSKAENLYLFVREINSFNFCTSVMNLVNQPVLIPDMAFLYRKPKLLEKNNKSQKIGFCFRNDCEKIIDDECVSKIIGEAVKCGLEIKYIKTCIANKRVRMITRKKIIDKKIDEIAKLDLLVTDRLHAMIMAYLAGTKCLAFDNLTHKVSGVYGWIEKSERIRLANNETSAVGQFIELLDAEDKNENDIIDIDYWKGYLSGFFESMADIDRG